MIGDGSRRLLTPISGPPHTHTCAHTCTSLKAHTSTLISSTHVVREKLAEGNERIKAQVDPNGKGQRLLSERGASGPPGTASQGAGEHDAQCLRAVFVNAGREWGGHGFKIVGWALN